MRISTKYRTEKDEIMDDFSMVGEELREALDQIASINKLLGGNKLTLNGVKKLLKNTKINTSISIVDIGCGNGDMLRLLADYAFKNNIKITMIGIDANAYTVNYARNLSTNYPNIKYICMDIFSEEFASVKYDIVLCTLTLHHFSNEKVMDLITTFKENATVGIVINELQRSKLAYRLFEIICVLFRFKKMSREDGLVSILRGFKKSELESISRKLDLKNYTIQWRWAFRYQWIIAKI